MSAVGEKEMACRIVADFALARAGGRVRYDVSEPGSGTGPALATGYAFGGVAVHTQARRVVVRGREVSLSPRCHDLLVALIERRGRLVSKDEILEAVWRGGAVEEGNIHVQLAALRRALGADASAIVTVPRRGLQFVAAVTEMSEAQPAVRVASPRPLLGREAELRDVADLLRAHRMVAVVGPGGVGKTALALRVAREMAGNYPDGVWWADLGEADSDSAVATAIAAAAGIRPGDPDALDTVAAVLRDRAGLIVLDGCERAVTAVAAAADRLLSSGPRLRLLVTSQERLRLPGEHAYALPPLALPTEDATDAQARTVPSLAVLERHVQALQPGFQLEGWGIACARRLCRRLDGLPLALELAAVTVAALGLEGACVRACRQLTFAAEPGSALPPHQRSLRASFERSHALLGPRERIALRRLATIDGRFDLATARAVLGMEGLGDGSALDVLEALCDKSFVQVAAGEARRYRLLETTRQFARGVPERDATRHDHPAAARVRNNR